MSAGRHRGGGGGGDGLNGREKHSALPHSGSGSKPWEELRVALSKGPLRQRLPVHLTGAVRGMDPGQVKHPRRGAPAPGGQSLIQSHSAQVPIGQRTAMKTHSNCSVSSLLILAAGPVQGPALLSPRPFHGIISHPQILPGHRSTCQSLLLTSVPELPTCWAHCAQQVLALVLPTDIKNLKKEGK